MNGIEANKLIEGAESHIRDISWTIDFLYENFNEADIIFAVKGLENTIKLIEDKTKNVKDALIEFNI